MAEPKPRPPLKPIPAFASREVEAEFWDTHDLTDYFAFDRRTPFGPVDSGLEQVTLTVDSETLELAKAIASEQAIPWQALLHLWLIERRDAERKKRSVSAGEQQRESA